MVLESEEYSNPAEEYHEEENVEEEDKQQSTINNHSKWSPKYN